MELKCDFCEKDFEKSDSEIRRQRKRSNCYFKWMEIKTNSEDSSFKSLFNFENRGGYIYCFNHI